jgi:gamma-glutamyltranspeptidase/glutathione hydrolase
MPVMDKRRFVLSAALAATLSVGLASLAPMQAVAQTQTQTQTAAAPRALLNYEAVHHPVMGTQGMVVSQNHIATQVGADILAKGGNAVDAAVAVGFALAVSLPRAGNLGGDGFMLVHLASENRAIAIDYRSMSPQTARAEDYTASLGGKPEDARFGYRASGVPGTVAGLAHAHAQWGRLSWAEVVEPARKLADEGVVLSHAEANATGWAGRTLRRWEAGRDIFFKADGSLYQAGEVWRQPDLAWTLGQIKDHGPDAFYRGAVAERIVASMQKHGGFISHADLAAYRPVERQPLESDYRGHRILTMPPPSGGGVMMLEMLNLVERFDLKAMGSNTAASLHVMAEAMKLAQADRSRYIGDPDFNAIPANQLVSQAYADDRSQLIDQTRTLPRVHLKAGDPWEVEGVDTTHFSVVDAEGNVVSNTYTLGSSYGSGAVIDGAGFLLNDQMKNFRRGDPALSNNVMAPGKRMTSTMMPTIVFKDDKPWLVTGTPGGSTIPNTLFQIIVNVVDHGMNVAEATQTPRIHQDGVNGGLQVEPGINGDTRALLQALGHRVSVDETIGSSQSIMIDNSRLLGAADTRRPDATAVALEH